MAASGSMRRSIAAEKPARRRHVDLARRELDNLQRISQACAEHQLDGVPRAIGDFSALGAVVCTKINGLPLQSIVMKAALLPDFGNDGMLDHAARRSRRMAAPLSRCHRTRPLSPLTAKRCLPKFESSALRRKKMAWRRIRLQSILEYVGLVACQSKEAASVIGGAERVRSAERDDFRAWRGVLRVRQLQSAGNSLQDVATFLAAVEALEKYPFCDRSLTALVQDSFLRAYGVNPQEQQLLTVLKLKVLLQMFAQGRTVKESANARR